MQGLFSPRLSRKTALISKAVITSRLTISVIPAKAPNPVASLLGLMIGASALSY
jgi:hypothetical protein